MSIPYRLSALGTISGFRTVSDEAATVLTGMLPEDILANEMEKIYMARIGTGDAVLTGVIRSERGTSMATLQERWNTANKGDGQWIRRRNGEMNFHLRQFFTGHGGYRKYLYSVRHEVSPECPNCPILDEDPEYVLYQCSRYREVVSSVPPPEGPVAFMLEG
ncbi:uncharacterized protein Dvir_GJ25899 [Drosophila virilis]|uniref:Reverse transcriptase zinc-binding domain-containing protein n=1 Tax=Drosophila virilis TaxID=7244 RepID=A0A0Q9WSQ1_DROVI|nr:uncharacterized protein Dvir_GJ25899 [Drosophila virilis]